jgi:hypothetical protein
MLKNFKLLRPILVVLILFVPLYPKFPIAFFGGNYVAFRLDDIVVSLAIFLWGLYQIKNKFSIFRLKIGRLFLVYFLAIIASTVTAVLIYQTTPTTTLLLHLLRRFEYISLFFITVDCLFSAKNIGFTYSSLLLATAGVSAYGFGQKYLRFPIISTMNSEFAKGQLLQMDVWTRISSTFAGHYDLAVFMSLVLIIIGTVALINTHKLVKIISLIVWLPSFYIFTLTAARVSVFAFWAGMVFTLIIIKKFIWIIPVSFLVVFSILNSPDLNQRLLATIPSFQHQFFSSPTLPAPTAIPTLPPIAVVTTKPLPTPKIIITPIPTIFRHTPEEFPPVDADIGVARSGEIRFNVEWPRAITAYRKNMITGTGLGSITLATDNDYLRMLGETGLFGFISFFVIIAYFVFKTIPLIFKSNKSYKNLLSLIFLGSLITMLTNCIFIDALEASKTAYLFWIMMGVYYYTLNAQN